MELGCAWRQARAVSSAPGPERDWIAISVARLNSDSSPVRRAALSMVPVLFCASPWRNSISLISNSYIRRAVRRDWAGGASASAGALEAAACGAAGVCASVAVAARASASPQATR